PARRLDQDQAAGGNQEHAEPEREEAALRAVGAPADPDPDGVENHDATHQEKDGRGDEVGDAHGVRATSSAVPPWPSGPCGAARSPPPTCSTRDLSRTMASVPPP